MSKQREAKQDYRPATRISDNECWLLSRLWERGLDNPGLTVRADYFVCATIYVSAINATQYSR